MATKIYYPVGGSKVRRDEFYKCLQDVKDHSVSSEGMWGSFYYYTTYKMKDGREVIYTEDTEKGIPYSLEVKEN